jgi:sugar phosphate isomerase/epimerase
VTVVSFITANYVARESGYVGGDDWMTHDVLTNAAFEPLETYEERLDEVMRDVATAGFTHVDLWLAHLNWRWATPEHVAIARHVLEDNGLSVVSLAGNFGSDAGELAAACRLASALDVAVLGGLGAVLQAEPDAAVAVLREHSVRFAYENHPEATPDEVLALIGDAADVVGVAVDTGWWATQGYDPVRAIRELGDRLFHVHLKDVAHVGLPHDTCEHGTGIVDIAACVQESLRLGYDGPLSVEHEPFGHDPTDACVRMRIAIEEQLAPVPEVARD